jgi:DNA-directed RNA polymerase subunit M/transcription elongation factor TFIIS
MTMEILQELIICERLRSSYPAGMSVRACMRHRLEMRLTRGEKGAVLSVDPKHPYCASECSVGLNLAERAIEAGALMRSCPTCGAALIGEAARKQCETCTDREIDTSKTRVPSGVLPARLAQSSERIWNGEAPNVPIGRAPSALTPGEEAVAAAVARVARKPAAAPWANQGTRKLKTDDQPDDPAKESEMACSECGSKTCHKATCSKRPGGAKELPKLPAKPRMAKREKKTLVRVASHKLFDVAEASIEQLVETIEACRSELVERRVALKEQLGQVEEALGEAA